MKHQQGFTLLELLLSLSIFSVVSLAGFNIFQTVLRSEESSQQKIDEINQLQTAFLLLERDFTQIARRYSRTDDNDSTEGFIYTESEGISDEVNEVLFVRHGWSNPGLLIPRGDLQKVGYRLIENKLERIHYNYVDSDFGEEPKVRVLLNDVSELSFEFYYESSWQKTPLNTGLPQGIAITVTSEHFGSMRRQFLVSGDANG